MANSSRARAVNKQNTAVLYYEPSENLNDAPVSTARVVGVGATAAAHGGSGATLQLVGRTVEATPSEAPSIMQPQVVEVEPPRAAARQRPVEKRPTRVIAYNVHIVATDGAQEDDETRFVDTEGPGTVDEPTSEPPEPQYDMRGRSHRHREQEIELTEQARRWAVDPQFRQPRAPQNEQFRFEPGYGAARPDTHSAPRERMPFAMPDPTSRSPRAQIPMSLFGALENMGAIRAHAGSYKQLLAQHLAAGNGPLLSNRNMCIAVGAYAFILFLLALFTG